MPITFIPKPNQANMSLCSAIDAFNKARPLLPSTNVMMGQTILFCSSLCLLLVSVPIMYKLRHYSRFYKVRPFQFTLFWIICSICWIITIHVPTLTLSFPCALSVILLCFSLCGFAALGCVRVLILTLETLYAKQVQLTGLCVMMDTSPPLSSSNHAMTIANVNGEVDEEDVISIHSEIALWASISLDHSPTTISSPMMKIHHFYKKTKKLLQIAIGYVDPTSLSLPDLLQAKMSSSSMIMASIVLILPAGITCFSVLIAIPHLSYCDCQDNIFAEMSISILTSLLFTIIISSRAIYVSYKALGFSFDSHGVLKEIAAVIIIPAPLSLLAGILMGFDPNNVAYLRQDMNWWALINFISFITFWWIVIGYQLVFIVCHHTYKNNNNSVMNNSSNNKKVQNNHLIIPPIMETINTNPEIRKEFEAYAEKQMVNESLHFLEDVSKYKLYFFEKAITWRIIKALHLFNIYLVHGSLLELNVSHHARMKVLCALQQTNNKNCQTIEMNIFDPVEIEITHMLTVGPWREFILKKLSDISYQKKKNKFPTISWKSTMTSFSSSSLV
jgi:hypothetical protein